MHNNECRLREGRTFRGKLLAKAASLPYVERISPRCTEIRPLRALYAARRLGGFGRVPHLKCGGGNSLLKPCLAPLISSNAYQALMIQREVLRINHASRCDEH